jgi:alpha-mannosidase
MTSNQHKEDKPQQQDERNKNWSRREFIAAVAVVAATASVDAEAFAAPREVFLVPNFHPASCGWLANFSKERIYCANTYLTHLDRVRDDPNYAFVLSEINNIIAIMNFQPDRIPELKQWIAEKRVELVNGYFLESTINLSGGEALVRLGVMGLRWYEKVFGLRPRFSWNIDVCGTHDQMPQIVSGLGMEALIYTRRNPTGKTMYWSYSPDGSRVLTISPGGYADGESIFETKTPLSTDELRKLESFFAAKEPITPDRAPILIIAGYGDYNQAPKVKEYPSQFLKQWTEAGLSRKLQFTTLSNYVDAVQPGIKSGKIAIPSLLGGTAYDFEAFWIENDRVKTEYRRSEHLLQAAEAVSTIASLQGSYEYAANALADCWVLMSLNMDRNTLWGSAGGMVFEDDKSWDVQDRFNWVQKTTTEILQTSGAAAVPAGNQVGIFNPLNWQRNDPLVLQLPPGKGLEGVKCETLADARVLCQPSIAGMSLGGWKLSGETPNVPRAIELPDTIVTDYYSARIDKQTGALTSLRLNSSRKELLGGPANVIVAERLKKKLEGDDPADHMLAREYRQPLATSSDSPSTIKVTEGAVCTTVEVSGTFYKGTPIRRSIRFYTNHPRIDFETEINDIPEHTVVIAEFPLAEDILEVRRGIPYGFSHGAWSKLNPNLHGWTKGIVPAVRWIDFAFSDGGLAIFDRGLSGRELNGRTPIIFLLNAEDKYWGYDNPWLSGKGKHVLDYSIAARDEDWEHSRIPQMACEYNRAPVLIADREAAATQTFLETSDNVIVEALRREGNHIELRMVEAFGHAGKAELTLKLPHRGAVITDLMGGKPYPLPKGPHYTLDVKPQQIITMQFETAATLPEPEPVTSWDRFVPERKLPALHAYDPTLVGHPPSGT